jgi:hypothetical protein
MSDKSAGDRLATYERTLTGFARWLANLQRPDGSLEIGSRTCPAYIPLPVYAHAVGDAPLLMRSLAYIERRCCEDAEAFLHPANPNLIPYRAAWMILGAHLSGEHLSLSRFLEHWMLRFAHRETSGLFGTEQARAVGVGDLCFDSTTIACSALCASGNVAEAERVGAFLRRLVDAQPEPDRRFLCTWNTQRGGLLTEFDAAQARVHAIEWAQPKQYLYKIGLLVRAFAMLHARTGDARHLEIAERFQRTAVERSPEVGSNTLAHKLAWSGWTLAVLTRKPEYAQDVCHVADHLMTLQQPDGGFHYPNSGRRTTRSLRS